MFILSNRFENAAAEAEEYVAMLRDALGSRDPIEELESMPEALGREEATFAAEQEAIPEALGKWSIGR